MRRPACSRYVHPPGYEPGVLQITLTNCADGAVEVEHVDCMGLCYAAGIRAFDRLLSINGELSTHGHSEAIEAMERSERFIEVVVAERVDSSPRPSGDAWLTRYQVDYA